MTAPRRLLRAPVLLAGWVVATLLVLPGSVLASTGPASPPPACPVATRTVVAGTTTTISGSIPAADASVEVLARRNDGRTQAVPVSTSSDTWQGVLLFGAADGGLWNLDIGIDSVWCRTQLTVTLPFGMVAQSTEPVPPGSLNRPVGDVGEFDPETAAFIGVALFVLASWIFLVVIAIAKASGARPLARRNARRVAAVAAFAGVSGAFTAVGLVVYFSVAVSHFDDGIPPDQQTLLNALVVGLGIAGVIVGALAARRVGTRATGGG